MPLHLTDLNPVASLPTPGDFEPGYPFLHEGLLKVVNAAQDGFDVVTGGASYAYTETALTVTTETTVITGDTLVLTLPAAPDDGRRILIRAYTNTCTITAGDNTDAIEYGTGTPNTLALVEYDYVELIYKADFTEWVQLNRGTVSA